MSRTHVASFNSKTRGSIEVFRSSDDLVAKELYRHSSDPGIKKTLGDKDLKRFAPDRFPAWLQKGGGRFLYTAWSVGHLAAAFWIGGEEFPVNEFPDSVIHPPYTAAWRTAYLTPEGRTFEGEGIGKRIALAGIVDVVKLTRSGGPVINTETGQCLPPLAEAGMWLSTGRGNVSGQALYEHLGNTDKDQEPVGFVEVGRYTPDQKDGMSPIDLETRMGMVADPTTIQRLVEAGGVLLRMVATES